MMMMMMMAVMTTKRDEQFAIATDLQQNPETTPKQFNDAKTK